MNLLRVGSALLLVVAAAIAGDVNGKWQAEMAGRGGEKRMQRFTFKADGNNLTGTVSGPMGEREISDGKVDGDAISFTVNMEFNGNKVEMKYSGKVAGDEIQFKLEGGPRSREFTAKRATS